MIRNDFMEDGLVGANVKELTKVTEVCDTVVGCYPVIDYCLSLKDSTWLSF